MRCGASVEKRDAATGQKNPASGQVRVGGQGDASAAQRAFGRRLPAIYESGGAHRAAPARMSRSGPSNDPVRSDNALG